MMENGITIDNGVNGANIEKITEQRNNTKVLNQQSTYCLWNKQYNDALKYSMQSISIYKNSIAFMNIALVYLKTNKLDKALFHLEESILLQENDEAYFHLGVCLLKLEKMEQSIKAFKNSIRINPSNIQSNHNLAFIYTQNNMNLKAIEINLNILDIDMLNIEALESLCVLYDKELDNENSQKYYDILYTKENPSSLAKLNMAFFYFNKHQHKKSKKILLQLISNNLYLEKSHQILGNIYKQSLDIKQAIIHYEKSISINKNDKTLIWNLGFLYLSKGDYIKGFSFLEKRYDTNLLEKKTFLKASQYNNEDLNNKRLFIYMEQGFGDNILLIRYIQIIKIKYPQSIILLSSRKELFTLFENIKEIDKIFDTEDIKEDYDYSISLFSMPFIFKTTIDTIPNRFPYIFPKKKEYNLQLDNNFLNIGIVWQSGDSSTTKEERSVSLDKFNGLSKNNKVRLFSLQKGDILEKDIENPLLFQDILSKINDFNDTANIILELDLIISVDTAVAHLAGSLNKKCFVILPEDTNWRWGRNGDKSPWFNSIKLFRMNSQCKNDVFIEIEKEVRRI